MNLNLLNKYLPEGGIDFVEKWLEGTGLVLKLKSSRKTKLGDYIFLREKGVHQITIDKELKPEPFFFVLTHEIAHLMVHEKYSKRMKSHGKEWKEIFGRLLVESVEVYNQDLKPFILKHAASPKANLVSDQNIRQKLFLKEGEAVRMLENLSENQKFRIGKRIFQKGKKRKIRYLCKEDGTGKLYLVNGQAIIDEIIEE